MPQRVPRHRVPRVRECRPRGEGRPNAAVRGYCDKAHQTWRLAVLLHDGYVCRDCRRVCGVKREAHADHVLPVSKRPDLRYDVTNGQCLCASCHQRKTNRERVAG